MVPIPVYINIIDIQYYYKDFIDYLLRVNIVSITHTMGNNSLVVHSISYWLNHGAPILLESRLFI